MRILLLTIFISFSILGFAQDVNFSQPFVANTYLNPALSGMLNGFVRVSTIYKEQGKNNIETPFKSMAVSADIKYDLKIFDKVSSDMLGVGLLFYNDRIDIYDFNTSAIELSVAFHKSLGYKNKQYLSIGFQGGVMQKNVNFENLTFEDMFNKVDGYTLSTSEPVLSNNFAVADFALGINHYYSPNKKFSSTSGISYSHFAQPNISFYRTETNFDNTSNLNPKITAYTYLDFKSGPFTRLMPRLVYYHQGTFDDLSLGSNMKFLSYDKENLSFHLGLHAHLIRDLDTYGVGPLSAFTGVQLKNLIIGVSYDVVMNHVIYSKRNLNSFELSISYLGDVEDEGLVCPQF